YRPDPWHFAEWAVAGCGVLSAVLLFANVGFNAAELNPSIYPLSWPTLPLVPAAAILLAGTAGFLAPPPSPPVRPTVPVQRTEEPK
ncbi:energy-coupling factor transporter transmembrane protein EcfT, partial [Streptomyces sp. NPDC054901]